MRASADRGRPSMGEREGAARPLLQWPAFGRERRWRRWRAAAHTFRGRNDREATRRPRAAAKDGRRRGKQRAPTEPSSPDRLRARRSRRPRNRRRARCGPPRQSSFVGGSRARRTRRGASACRRKPTMSPVRAKTASRWRAFTYRRPGWPTDAQRGAPRTDEKDPQRARARNGDRFATRHERDDAAGQRRDDAPSLRQWFAERGRDEGNHAHAEYAGRDPVHRSEPLLAKCERDAEDEGRKTGECEQVGREGPEHVRVRDDSIQPLAGATQRRRHGRPARKPPPPPPPLDGRTAAPRFCSLRPGSRGDLIGPHRTLESRNRVERRSCRARKRDYPALWRRERPSREPE